MGEKEEKGSKTRRPAFSTHVAINPLRTGDNGPYPRRRSYRNPEFTSPALLFPAISTCQVNNYRSRERYRRGWIAVRLCDYRPCVSNNILGIYRNILITYQNNNNEIITESITKHTMVFVSFYNNKNINWHKYVNIYFFLIYFIWEYCRDGQYIYNIFIRYSIPRRSISANTLANYDKSSIQSSRF